MASKVRVTMNHAGIRALLNSGDVVNALESAGSRVLAAANGAVSTNKDRNYGEPFEMQTYTGGTRARTYVRTNSFDGMYAEAVNGILTKALGGS